MTISGFVVRIKHKIKRIKYRNNVEKYVGHFFLCGSECPDKSGVYEYCKRLPPYSLPDVMMEFVLGLPGGRTLSLPAARSYVGIINSRVLTTSRPDLSPTCPETPDYQLFLLLQHSSSQTSQTLSLEMNQPEVLLSLF